MNKFWKYIAGVIKAVQGDYPYEQLEHFEYVKRQLKYDDDSLNAEHPGYKILTARHVSICGPAWRGSYLLSHVTLRNKLRRMDVIKKMTVRPPQKEETFDWRLENRPEMLFVERNHNT